MSSPSAPRNRKRGTTPQPNSDTRGNGNVADAMETAKQTGKGAGQKDWDYKLALAAITVLAFVTRFWGISHPNQVVFDEVHFGKVRAVVMRPVIQPIGR